MTSPLSLVTTPPIESIEQEFAKDVWDVRRIPGVRYPAHRSDNSLNFTQVPSAFRADVKRYLRFRLIQRSFSECSIALRHIRTFLAFFVASHPTATDLKPLKRADIEAYLLHLQGIVETTNRYGKLITRDYMWDAVARLQYFLEYLERTSSPGAPLLPVGRLLWLDDRGKKVHQRDREIKYIPEHVLFQLEQHMHLLPPHYLPIVVILRASGWRISDVLNLRYDTCLEHTNNGWWLRGDIQKTDVLNHKVPSQMRLLRS